MAEDSLRFGILGPLQVIIGDTAIPLGTPKQRAVLATLLVNRNKPVALDALMETVWQRGAPAGARATLYAYVSNLRHLLAGAGLDSRAILTNAQPGYRLAVRDSQYDLGVFATEKNAGVRAAAEGKFEQASDHFTAALAQWRGPVLDDLHDFKFVDAFAAGLTEEKVVTHTARAEVVIACGRPQSVINELEMLVVDYPYREPLWAQLITAYYLADRQADALDAYRRLRAMLADDLGVDPGPTLRGLHERILRQQSLDVGQAAQSSADETISTLKRNLSAEPGAEYSPALFDAEQRRYPLAATTTRIGRSPDNDIVLPGGKVSRHHAAIVDTGSSFVMVDLRSVNGVYVRGRRVHASAVLNDGDDLRIADHRLTFETNRQQSATEK